MGDEAHPKRQSLNSANPFNEALEHELQDLLCGHTTSCCCNEVSLPATSNCEEEKSERLDESSSVANLLYVCYLE